MNVGTLVIVRIKSQRQGAFMSIEPFIKSSDIKASLHFYGNILDFEVVQAPDPDPESVLSKYAFLKRGDGYIHISQHAGDGVFGNVIYVRVKNLHELYNAFRNNGLKVQKNQG
jgi:hypothetical protein